MSPRMRSRSRSLSGRIAGPQNLGCRRSPLAEIAAGFHRSGVRRTCHFTRPVRKPRHPTFGSRDALRADTLLRRPRLGPILFELVAGEGFEPPTSWL